MRKPVLALLGCLAIAAILAAALGWDRRDEPARPTATPDPVAEAPARVPSAVSLPMPPPSVPSPAAPAAPAPAPAMKPAASAVRSTFALSSEHRALVQEATLAAADLQLLEREERDNAWASEAEARIRAELAAHPSFANFEIVAIDCRQSLCAVQAFSYGEDGNRKWVTAFDDLYRQSLVQAFDSLSTAFPNEGSRAAVLTFLHRKPGAAKP